MKGGERHPTPRKALRRDITKNDKRKTVRAVTPLRFIDILVLICRNLTSTSWVEIPLALTRIFLTGCPPIPDMIYVNGTCYLQAIKIPPNLKQIWREKLFLHENTTRQNAVFLFDEL